MSKFSCNAGNTSQFLWTSQALGLVTSLALGYHWAPLGHVGFVWSCKHTENEYRSVFAGQWMASGEVGLETPLCADTPCPRAPCLTTQVSEAVQRHSSPACQTTMPWHNEKSSRDSVTQAQLSTAIHGRCLLVQNISQGQQVGLGSCRKPTSIWTSGCKQL